MYGIEGIPVHRELGLKGSIYNGKSRFVSGIIDFLGRTDPQPCLLSVGFSPGPSLLLLNTCNLKVFVMAKKTFKRPV